MTPRRFPPPWYAEDNGACFIVKDASSLAVAYVYYELKPGRRTASNNLMTRDEARRTIGGRECSVGADLDGKRKSSRVRLFAPRTIWPRRSTSFGCSMPLFAASPSTPIASGTLICEAALQGDLRER
jgi:hypothetical protein